jgi:hypothetical protein
MLRNLICSFSLHHKKQGIMASKENEQYLKKNGNCNDVKFGGGT